MATTNDSLYEWAESASIESIVDRIRELEAENARLREALESRRVAIHLEDDDAIEIGRDVKQLFHSCCNCGATHLVTVTWAENTVILQWRGYPVGQDEITVAQAVEGREDE